MIRQEVEQTLKLATGTLDAKDYKDSVKSATDAVLVSYPPLRASHTCLTPAIITTQADDDDPDDDIPIQSASKFIVKGKKRKSEDVEADVSVKTVKKPKAKSAKKPKLIPFEVPETKKEWTHKDSGPRKVFKSAVRVL
jgi:hypothetical protein